jgi:hypothetical protein
MLCAYKRGRGVRRIDYARCTGARRAMSPPGHSTAQAMRRPCPQPARADVRPADVVRPDRPPGPSATVIFIGGACLRGGMRGSTSRGGARRHLATGHSPERYCPFPVRRFSSRFSGTFLLGAGYCPNTNGTVLKRRLLPRFRAPQKGPLALAWSATIRPIIAPHLPVGPVLCGETSHGHRALDHY